MRLSRKIYACPAHNFHHRIGKRYCYAVIIFLAGITNELIDSVEAIIQTNLPWQLPLRKSWKILHNKISMAMGMENGGPIEGDLANAKHFYDRGIRYITLTHSKSNHIADSSYDENKRLSDFGKELVPEMNRLGIMVMFPMFRMRHFMT